MKLYWTSWGVWKSPITLPLPWPASTSLGSLPLIRFYALTSALAQVACGSVDSSRVSPTAGIWGTWSTANGARNSGLRVKGPGESMSGNTQFMERKHGSAGPSTSMFTTTGGITINKMSTGRVTVLTVMPTWGYCRSCLAKTLREQRICAEDVLQQGSNNDAWREAVAIRG